MNPKMIAPIVAGVIALLVVSTFGGAFYIVDEREQVVVTRFDKPTRIIVGDLHEDFELIRDEIVRSATRTEENEGALDIKGLRVDQGPGLYFKFPFIDVAERFPDTLLEYDVLPGDIVTRDKKNLSIDNFARWRIENPLLFRLRVRTVSSAASALDDVIFSIMREELGQNNLIEIVRTTKVFELTGEEDVIEDELLENTMTEVLDRGREEIMNAVTLRADKMARERYGIRIIDVRIKRAELLPENLNAVFQRMQAERERISKGYRSEGEKQAAIIRGETDKKVQVLLANATREAQETRGEGDAQVLKIYADAFGSNPELYKYIRSLEVMKEATPTGSELVLGLGSSLYNLMNPED